MFRTLLSVLVLALAMLPAQGFLETFDGYQVGTTLPAPWSLMGASPGLVSVAPTPGSSPHVLAFGPASLGVFGGPPWGQYRQLVPAPICGQWRLRTFVRVQDSGTTTLVRLSNGDPNFVILPWALNLSLDWATSEVRVNAFTNPNPLPFSLPAVPSGIEFAPWLEIQIDVDLDTNSYALALDGMPVSSGIYASSGPVVMTGLQIRSDHSAPFRVYWDDISLEATTPMPYERNRPEASLALDGVLTCGQAPAALSRYSTDIVSLSVGSSLAGAPSEIMATAVPLIPLGAPGGASLQNGQVVNLNLFHPTFGFVNGGAVPNLLPVSPGTIAVSLTTIPVGATISAQLLVYDPTTPDCIVVSQGVQIEVVSTPQ